MTPKAIEQASPDVREVLELAFFAVFGPKPPSEYDGRAWTRNEPDFSPAWEAWVKADVRFKRMLDAEAYLDAAMMLVPEGWLTRIVSFAEGNDSTSVYWRCGLRTWDRDDDGVVHPRGYICVSDTPALAIAASSLRAKGPGHEQ